MPPWLFLGVQQQQILSLLYKYFNCFCISYFEQSMHKFRACVMTLSLFPALILTEDWLTLQFVFLGSLNHFDTNNLPYNHLISLRTLQILLIHHWPYQWKDFQILRKGLSSNRDTQSPPLYLTNWLIYTTEESCANRWELQGFMCHNKKRRIVRFCAKQPTFSVLMSVLDQAGATTTNHLEKGN